MPVQTDLIAGAAREPAIELGGVLEDPNTGEVVGRQRATSREALEGALDAASLAWGGGRGSWSGIDLEGRAALLERFAEALDVRAEGIAVADAFDSGVPLSVTRAIAGSLGGTMRGVVATAREALAPEALPADGRRVELHRLPFGPAALLTPWNAPSPTAVTKIANALAAGCPAILKPSEHAPGAAALIAEAALEAELPAGALQVVHGGADVAMVLASDARVRVVSLTGGAAAGRAVAAVAAARMAALQLELGGTNPAIVTEDAAVETTARALAEGMTKLNGQWCEAPRRVLVARERHDDLVDALRDVLSAVRIGPTGDDATTMGPLSHRAHRDRVVARTNALGGTAQATADVPDLPGFFLSPTVVTGADANEEIFGPVITVRSVGDDDEAVGAANALGDGLAAYVFAGDADRAFALGRTLHAGEVRLGGTHLLDLAPGSAQAFWGSSGIGGHGQPGVLLAHTGARIVGEDDPALPV